MSVSTKLYLDCFHTTYIKAAAALDVAADGMGWKQERFTQLLGLEGVHGTVALVGRRLVGWLVNEDIGDRYRLLGMAVHPEYQRQGIGTTLLACVLDRPVIASVRESALSMCLFLREMGFKGRLVRRDDGRDDLIVFSSVLELEGER